MSERQRRITKILGDIRSQYPKSVASVVEWGRLHGVPAPIVGEAFSSWCWRASIEHGYSSATILRQLGIEVPAFWVDAGRGRLDVPRISAVVMQPIQNFDTFRWSQDSLLSVEGLACLTTVPLRQRPTYRYCENCLSGDSIPHIRLLWRQACAYVCPVHGSVLREVCPHCQRLFSLPKYQRKRAVVSPNIRDCQHCGKDVSVCASVHLPQELHYYVLGRQTELIGLIGGGAGSAETRQISQLSTHGKFAVGPGGVIDVNLLSNQELLFQCLLANRVVSGRDGNLAATKHPQLERYLLKIEVRTKSEEIISLTVGLDGSVLFGEMSRYIAAKYLYGIQDVCGSTFWWPFERGNPFQVSGLPFTDARFVAAAKWIEKCGPAAFDE